MDGYFYIRVGFGVILILAFLVALFRMATIRIESQRTGAITGFALLFMAVMQVLMVWGGLRSLPDWALVVVLIGTGFGMSAGLLMIKGAMDSRSK